MKRLACFQTKQLILQFLTQWASQVLSRKEFACNARGRGDVGSVPGLGRSPGGGNGKHTPGFSPGKSVARGAWWATIHSGHKESDTAERLSARTHAHTCTHTHTCRWPQIQFWESCLSWKHPWNPAGRGDSEQAQDSTLAFLCVLANFLPVAGGPVPWLLLPWEGHSIQGDRNWVVSKWPSHQRKEVSDFGAESVPAQNMF